jgi:cupin superfamily acireductone dioxygenase involved in methionine salvage
MKPGVDIEYLGKFQSTPADEERNNDRRDEIHIEKEAVNIHLPDVSAEHPALFDFIAHYEIKSLRIFLNKDYYLAINERQQKIQKNKYRCFKKNYLFVN